MTPMRTGLATVAGLSCLALTAAGCGGGDSTRAGNADDGRPRTGGTLQVIGAGGQTQLDATNAYSVSAWALARTYTRQLFTYPAARDVQQATAPVADAAQELPTRRNDGISKDGTTYTIKLRPGVRWDTQPARELTAGDFVRSFKRMCNPAAPVGAPNYYIPLIAGMKAYCTPFLGNAAIQGDAKAIAAYQNGHEISGVQAKDDKTLVIRLTQAAPDFVNILALTFASAVPKEYDAYVPGSQDLYNHLVSAGPYKIVTARLGRELVFARNPAWRQDSDPVRHQYLEKIHVTMGMESPEAVQQQLERGTNDIALDQPVPAQRLTQLLTSGDPNFGLYGGGVSNPYLVFNMHSRNAGAAVTKLQVRQAIAYAVDKVAIARAYGGPKIGKPLHTAIPSGSVGYQEYNPYPTPGDRGDPAKCKELLKQAGYPQGLTLTAVFRQAGNHPAVARSYAEDLKRCGITVQLIPLKQEDFYEKFLRVPDNAKSSKWDVATPGWVPDWFGNNGRANATALFDGRNWVDGTTNFGGYNNPAVNQLIDRANEARTKDEAQRLWHQVDEQVMRDVAIVPLIDIKTPLYHSARVRNAVYLPTMQLFDYTNVWLNPTS